MSLPQELVAVSHDALHIIQEAVNTESCSSINGSDIRLEDRNTMLTCMRKVSIFFFRNHSHLILKLYPLESKRTLFEKFFFKSGCLSLVVAILALIFISG